VGNNWSGLIMFYSNSKECWWEYCNGWLWLERDKLRFANLKSWVYSRLEWKFHYHIYSSLFANSFLCGMLLTCGQRVFVSLQNRGQNFFESHVLFSFFIFYSICGALYPFVKRMKMLAVLLFYINRKKQLILPKICLWKKYCQIDL